MSSTHSSRARSRWPQVDAARSLVSGAGKPWVWFIDQFDEIALRTDANDLLVVEDDGEDAGGSDHDGDWGVIVFHAQRVSLFVAREHHVFSLTLRESGIPTRSVLTIQRNRCVDFNRGLADTFGAFVPCGPRR